MKEPPSARQTDAAVLADQLLRLQHENADLKRSNMEKNENVKKLSVQLTRIRNDWQQQAASGGKDLISPVAKARAAAAASKEDRISELEVELHQRSAREERLQQQLTLLKQQVGQQSASGRGPVTRQKRVGRAPSATSSRGASGTRGGSVSGPGDAERPPPSRGEAWPDAPSAEGAAVGGAAGGATGSDMGSLLQMLQDKEHSIDELRAQLALHEQANAEADAAGASAATAGISAAAAGVPDSAVSAELRRQLKKSGFELSLLEQKYQHLEARFNQSLDNHEKVLTQMADLNGALKKERAERARLQQEAHQGEQAQIESQEKALENENLRAELAALQDDNRKVLARVFSNDDAGELTRARQEVAMRDAEIKKLKEAAKKDKETQHAVSEATSKVEGRLSLVQVEREEARRAERKAVAVLGEKDEEIARLQRQIALLTGDTGVSPQEIERALAMVVNATASTDDTKELRLVDTNLDELGLSPLAKKEVHSVLLQNNELNKDLEKAELLLKNQMALRVALTSELEAAKRTASEEVQRLQRRESQRTTELADAKRSLLQLQEAVASGAGGGRGGGRGVARGDRAAYLPLGVGETESVADSTISDGTHSELDVRPEENVFELRVVRATLTAQFFNARPSTFTSFDFFQHDTQASPMRQGLEPEYDFTAQFVLTVDDLFLHYASTSVLAIEVYQSLGIECALVARTDAPLRELVQGRRGKLLKHAQLYAIREPLASGAPQVVGTLIYEMRMRRRMDTAVHSFMQRFPDVATLALMPVRPGALTSEAIITVHEASGLRLRLGGGAPPAPYVHFEFFEYGEHETAAKEGAHPKYGQEFRFPVERDTTDFVEYLKQAKVRFTLFDEAEEDTEAMLGHGELSLAPLLSTSKLHEPSVALVDIRGQPAGSLSISIELRDASQPKPISLGLSTVSEARGATDGAATRLQAAYRGWAVRQEGSSSSERAVALDVEVRTLQLGDELLNQRGLGAVWVEVDVLGLARDTFRTKRVPPQPTTPLGFESSLRVKAGGAEGEALRRALTSATQQDSDIHFMAMATGTSGNQQLGVGFVNIKELYHNGRDLPSANVTLRGAGERRVGSCEVSIRALAAMHRAAAADSVRVCVGAMHLPDDLLHDPSVAELWVQVDLACVGLSTAVRTRALSKGANADFNFTHSVLATPGSAALLALKKALATKEESDSDVYFILMARGQPSAAARGQPQPADREIAEGYLNLEALLRGGRDLVNTSLSLSRKDPEGEPVALTVSLMAVEALRRINSPVAPSDAIQIDVGELQAKEALMADSTITDVWVDVDVLDLDGGQPLRTNPLRKSAAKKMDFLFSRLLPVPRDGPQLDALRSALTSSEEQDSDVYFALKGRGPRVAEKELAQGFVNLKELSQGGKEPVRSPINLIADDRREYGTLVISVIAGEVLKRVKTMRPKGSKDTMRVEIGSLELSPAVAADTEVTQVWADVDILGLGDPASLTTPRAPKGTAATIEFAFAHTVGVPAGSRQQATLRNALVSEHSGDAEVYFSVRSANRRGEEKVVGQGALNLKDALLLPGQDVESMPIALQGPKGAAGKLNVSLVALEVMKAAVPTSLLETMQQGHRSAADAAAAKAKPPSVRVEVSTLSLASTVKADPEVGEVWVEVDLVEIGDRAALTTQRLRKLAVPLDFKFSHSVAVAPGSKDAATLRSVLDAADEQESDVYFEVMASSRTKGDYQLGQGFLNLKRLLSQGKDMVSVPVPLQGGKGPVGTLKASLVALEALRSLEQREARGSGSSGSSAAPSTRPAAKAGATPADVQPAAVGKLTLEVSKLALTPAVRQDVDVSDVWIEIDLLGMGDPKALKTERLHKMASPLDFGYAHIVDVAAGSKEEATLKTVLQAADEQESDVYFELKTANAHGEAKEIASGYLNLKKAYHAKQDHVQVAVALQGRVGNAGTLTVTILAVDAIKAALAPPAPAPAASASSAQRLPTDMVRVDIGKLVLSPSLKSSPEVGEVWVEINLVEIGDRAALTTQRLRKLAVPLDFKFSHSVAVAPGSKDAATLRSVLDAADEQESDVFFELQTSNRTKGEYQVGQGFLNLKQILNQGKDMVSVPVPLQGREGSAAAGTLTVTLSAIHALRNVMAAPQPQTVAPSSGPDVYVDVEVSTLSLASTVKADPEVGEVWVEINLVEIGDRAALTTQRLRKLAVPLDFKFSHSVAVAPGSKDAATLRSVLDAADEQESDVYFEVMASSRTKGDYQLGQGFLNLKRLLSQGKDMVSVPVPLQGGKGPVGTLKASLVALEALRSLVGQQPSRALTAPASAARAPAAKVRAGPSVRVDIGSLTIMPALRENIDVREVWVEVDLVEIGDRAALTTQRLRKLAVPLDFKFSHSVAVATGSPEEATLKEVLQAASEQDSDVYFILKSVNARGAEIEVGQSYLNLKKVLTESRDVIRAAVPVSSPQNGDSLGTLTVSLVALEALRQAESSTGLISQRLPRGAPAAADATRATSASKFVGSFSASGGAPAAAAAPARASTTARTTTATGTAKPATATARPATATAIATVKPATVVTTAAAPAGSSYRERRPPPVSPEQGPSRAGSKPGSPGAAPAQARSPQSARQPALEGTDSALSIRVESLTLGASLQRDPNIRSLFVSLKVLGGEFNTPDMRKVSPPIRVNETFKIPVEPGSRAQQELLRVMLHGAPSVADIAITVCWYDASSSGGGDEGEPVAFGAINLRQLWQSKRDLSSHTIELLDDDTNEVTRLTVSTAIVPTLTRIMPRGR